MPTKQKDSLFGRLKKGFGAIGVRSRKPENAQKAGRQNGSATETVPASVETGSTNTTALQDSVAKPAAKSPVRNKTPVISDTPGEGANARSPSADPNESIFSVDSSRDLWSEAYREAIDTLPEKLDTAILKAKNVSQLFSQLEQIDADAEKSIFFKGQDFLKSIKVPLETFKLTLDLASPLTSMEPTAKTVFGAVSTVTAIAISIASADQDFAAKIAEMLKKLPYVDDCDVLGQKTHRREIHDALVPVYQKLLEFYQAAYEILMKKGVKLMMSLMLQNDRLPTVIQQFLDCMKHLEVLIQKATLEVTEDIKRALYDQDISKWLEKEKMVQQHRYHSTLQDMLATNSCDFLAESDEFKNWYLSPGYQELILTGDMGSGKTLAMRYFCEELQSRNQRLLPRAKLFYYYFRDDGRADASDVFQGLILSILQMMPGLQKSFHEWVLEDQASGAGDVAANTKALGQYLGRLFEQLDRPLFVAIDGLDECDVQTRSRLLAVLRESSSRTPRLKTLFSSRPYKNILAQLGPMPRMNLISNPARDEIIARHTINIRLPHLSEADKALLARTLIPMAQGSAIWTKMAIELVVRRAVEDFSSAGRLLADLPLPRDLSELYDKLVEKSASHDAENQDIIHAALELLAVTRRPFSIREISWAVTLATIGSHVSTVASLGSLVDHGRIMNLINPFISGVDYGDLSKHQVRLVHQSVKEFVVNGWTSNSARVRKKTTGSRLASAEVKQRLEYLETFMLSTCVAFISLEEVGSIYIFDEHQIIDQELVRDANLFDEQIAEDEASWEDYETRFTKFNPADRGLGEFFTYAACQWLVHAATITQPSLALMINVQEICAKESMRLYNWIEQFRRPLCALHPGSSFPTSKLDPLGVICLFCSKAMQQALLESADFESPLFFDRPAIVAADLMLNGGEPERVISLFREDKLKQEMHTVEFFEMVVRSSMSCHRREDFDALYDLIYELPDDLFKKQASELIAAGAFAARTRCNAVIDRVHDRLRSRDKQAEADVRQS